MLQHVVLIKLSPGAPAGAAQHIMTALRALPDAIPEIISLKVGKNVVEAERNLDIGLIVEFRDRAALDAYAAHPAHVAVVQDQIQPVAQHLAVVDFEM